MNLITNKDEDFERVYKSNYQRYSLKIFFTGTKYYKKKKSKSSICKQTGQYHQDKNEYI